MNAISEVAVMVFPSWEVGSRAPDRARDTTRLVSGGEARHGGLRGLGDDGGHRVRLADADRVRRAGDLVRAARLRALRAGAQDRERDVEVLVAVDVPRRDRLPGGLGGRQPL